MSDIQDLEEGIKNAEFLLEQRQMAMRLAENRDFKKLFLEGYFHTEAARLVQLSADPVLDLGERADALAMAQATGHTKRFLSMMIQMGAVAERELPELRQALGELRGIEDGGADADTVVVE